MEKSRQANFMLVGVVAAKTPEAGQKTHDSIKHICETIMKAYEVANDSNRSRDEKVEAIRAVSDLGTDLDWLLHFVQEESEWCRFPELRQEMTTIHATLKGQTNVLKNGFRGLRVDIERFPEVFTTLLAFLEEVTEFLRLGHKTETARVGDSLKNAYAEASNLYNCELTTLLVDQAKLASTRVNDAWKAVDNLVKIQPGLNEDLVPRIDNVDQLLRSCLPDLILRTKEVLVTRKGDPGAKSDQTRAYKAVESCLDEIKRILAKLTANYINQFDESASRIPLNLDPLEAALKGVVKAIADLKGAQLGHEPEAILIELADQIPEFVRVAIAELQKMGATDEEKREFVEAVKKARDGDAADFFQAQEDINNLLDRIRNKPPPPKLTLAAFDEGPSKSKDLLAAAKEMCSALSKLNFAIDE